jgi:hypothetical protein
MSRPKPQKSRQIYTLWVHDNNFSAEELVINPEYFPTETQVGDILEIYKPSNRDKRLYLSVGAVTSVKGTRDASPIFFAFGLQKKFRIFLIFCVRVPFL